MVSQPLVLVNEQDDPVGLMEKMEVHRKGLLHRAFSVFIFDAEGRMLLQQRAAAKYHGGLLWTNACCSHPYPNEAVASAALRRLKEELGFETALQKIFAFTYRAVVENGLVEHEYDHVFVGRYEGSIQPNADEVEAFRYCAMHEIKNWLADRPNEFTTWFRLAFPQVETWWRQEFSIPPR